MSEDPISSLWLSPQLILSKMRVGTLSRYLFTHSFIYSLTHSSFYSVNICLIPTMCQVLGDHDLVQTRHKARCQCCAV